MERGSETSTKIEKKLFWKIPVANHFAEKVFLNLTNLD